MWAYSKNKMLYSPQLVLKFSLNLSFIALKHYITFSFLHLKPNNGPEWSSLSNLISLPVAVIASSMHKLEWPCKFCNRKHAEDDSFRSTF